MLYAVNLVVIGIMKLLAQWHGGAMLADGSSHQQSASIYQLKIDCNPH